MDGLYNSTDLLVPLGDCLEIVREEKINYGYTHQLVMSNPTAYLKLSVNSLYDMLDIAMEHDESLKIYSARSELLKKHRELEYRYEKYDNISRGDYLEERNNLRVEVDIPDTPSVNVNTDFEKIIVKTIQNKILKSEDYYFQYNNELYNLTPIKKDASDDGCIKMEFDIGGKIK